VSARGDSPGGSLLGDVDGRVEGHRDGHGFVVPDSGEPLIWLAPQEMHAVLHRDRVRVRIARVDRKGRPEGRVLEILERHKAPVIGRLLHEGGHWIVAPEDKRYGQDILIPKNGIATAQPGQVVAVELTEPPSLHAQPVGRVTEVLGQIDDPGMEIEIAVRKYEVPHRFSAGALAEAAALPDKLRAADRRHRIDLSDVPLVTIDGEDARDFDDAVYCEPWQPEPAPVPPKKRTRKAAAAEPVPEGTGGWRLLVAIADVSHYVKPGEVLDDDAYERATSVYFPRRVIPMLPEKLSNGLCSLNPDVDRLCMVCDMLITSEGELHAYQFYPAVMHSHARFTYTEVAAILANTRGPEAARRQALVPQLLHLHEAYRALLKARGRRGAMDFETTETQIVCDEQGRIEKIVPRTRTEAHRLIEEAMLAANVCAARFIAEHEHPGLFRVHEGPTPEKRATLQAYLRALGLGLSISDDPSPAEFAAIAAATQGRPDSQQIHTMLLRSMQQAIYTPVNSGHFGLAYGAYTHFTSPIRRYPDLLVHRVIKALLGRKRYHHLLHPGTRAVDPRAKRRLPPLPRAQGKPPSEELLAWEATGAHCSANERRADEASRDVEAWLKCAYMREKLGEEYGGTVTSVAGFGLFVTLDGLYVEGLVHITELGGEYYKFDEVRQELRGERTGVRYAIGTRVRVQVIRVDLDGRKIDFRMVRDGEGERLLERGRGDRAKTVPPAGATSAQTELVKIKALDRQRKAQARERKAQASDRKSAGRGVGGKTPRSTTTAKRVAHSGKKKA
jgi:ribonuclease R